MCTQRSNEATVECALDISKAFIFRGMSTYFLSVQQSSALQELRKIPHKQLALYYILLYLVTKIYTKNYDYTPNNTIEGRKNCQISYNRGCPLYKLWFIHIIIYVIAIGENEDALAVQIKEKLQKNILRKKKRVQSTVNSVPFCVKKQKK